ncbi:MAG TPA: hypothetical protein VF126_04850 [Acidobacteriaceae bacterium]
MRRNRCPFALVTLIAFLPAIAASAQRAQVPPPSAPQGNCTHHDPATRPDCPAAIAFLTKFQGALKSNDPDAVASLVHYPLLVTTGGKRRISRTQLLADFDHIFTPTLRVAILSATRDDVWGNVHGFMVARGAIWFDTVIPRNAQTDEKSLAKYPMKLITINPVYP